MCWGGGEGEGGETAKYDLLIFQLPIVSSSPPFQLLHVLTALPGSVHIPIPKPKLFVLASLFF